jgi:ubiquinol-cytochrome c reductase subunit 8
MLHYRKPILGILAELVADEIPFAGSQPQKGVTSYALSANRQGPLKGTLNAAIFNTWRRFSAQVLYVAPPLIAAYAALSWAIER